MAMMWPPWAAAIPADSWPRCWRAYSAKYVSRATSAPGAWIPKTPHSSRGPSLSSIGAGWGGVTRPISASPAEHRKRAQPSNAPGPLRPSRRPRDAGSPAVGSARIRSTRRTRRGEVMSVESPVTLDRRRIQELIRREEERLNARTPGSAELFERANQVLSAGVASSYQLRDPWPIYLERGAGPKVWDVDGNEMWDFHNGFGSMVQG